MKSDQFKSYQIADIGDYLKVFACSAVISQPIMSLVMGVGQPTHRQDIFGILYNLVKYTAPPLFLVFCILQFVPMMKKVVFHMQNTCGQIGLTFLFLLFGRR